MKNWEIKKLGEVLKLEYGKPLPDENRITNGKYPVYGANGLKGRSNDFYFDKKTIVVGRKGSAGEINLTEEKFWPLDVTYFVTFDNKKYDLFFLFHLLSMLELPKLAKGVKPGINRNEVYDLEVSIPPLPEQQRIVSILDECFAAIDKAKANAEQNLKNAKELFESYLQAVFERKSLNHDSSDFLDAPDSNKSKKSSNQANQKNQGSDYLQGVFGGSTGSPTKRDGWEQKKLNEVFDIKPPKKEAKERLSDVDLVSFLPMEDLGICENEIKPIKERHLKDVAGSYTYFAENDVLLAKITPCFENGKLGVAKNLTNGIGFGSSEYIVFRCPQDIVPEFLFYFLSRESLREEGKKYMSGAVGHKRVSMEWIENYPFSFPRAINDQQTIVRQLDALRVETQKLEAVYQKRLADLEELKKSILQKAFNGELVAPTGELKVSE